MKLNTLLISIYCIVSFSCSANRMHEVTVTLPKISGPVQITSGGKEHFFASYYAINSFDRTERYATVLETDIKFRLPTEHDTATLGIVDLKTNKFIPLTQTHAWNFQQGCMAHWLGTSPDSLIIYNDYRIGRFLSVIMNVHTGKEIKTIPYPVCAVSPDGKEALSINFSRLRLFRPDYGYGGNGQEAHPEIPFPSDDGLFLINLENGAARLLISYEQIIKSIPNARMDLPAWINHTLFSKKGSKIFLLIRQKDDQGWITNSLSINKDGTNLHQCFPNDWGGSHFDWLNDNELMVTAKFEGKQYSHILFTAGDNNYKRLGNGTLDFDAHGTFSPDQKWMVTDTYPDPGSREQKILLMNMMTQAVLSLARLKEPEEFSGFWRCDLHCRWSPKGDIIGFNSTRSGSRQAYIFRLVF
jgi:hypothetical protein